MTLSGIKAITIPEGAVKQIVSGGRVLWKGGVDVAALAIGYTGAYTDQAEVTMSGKKYRLLTLTGSGTLTVDANVKADVWLCAGGNGGANYGYSGGGGGNFVQSDAVQLDSSTVCVIGAGSPTVSGGFSNVGFGGTTTFGAIEAVQATGKIIGSDGKEVFARACGASGGGGSSGMANADVRKGIGCGRSTIPFLESALFAPHSAGGGGGGSYDREMGNYYFGGDGGFCGKNGGSTATDGGADCFGGNGGVKGGGKGGDGDDSDDHTGASATFYGGGGGAGGEYYDKNGDSDSGVGGAGYQGVIYVRIPYDQNTSPTPDTARVPVYVTGTGNATYCYATINGTKYSGAVENIPVSAGDVITFGVHGSSATYVGWVKINDVETAKVTNKTTVTYTWTVPEGVAAISIGMRYYGLTSTSRYGRITVATA